VAEDGVEDISEGRGAVKMGCEIGMRRS